MMNLKALFTVMALFMGLLAIVVLLVKGVTAALATVPVVLLCAALAASRKY